MTGPKDDAPMPLKETLGEAEWSLLKPHAQRDALLIVDRSLDLLATAEKIAANDQASVSAWIERGMISKPTAPQLASWDSEPQQKFLSIIVQPFVLVQLPLVH